MITDAPPFNQPQASLLDHALAYAARGWSIIPVTGKKARFAWKRFQTTRPDKTLVRDWFSSRFGEITGVAVICGPVSGDLCVRDYDDQAAYDKWAATHHDLASTLPTVATARGRHVFFAAEERFEKYADGELRGTQKQITVLPPSLHPSGTVYRWLIAPVAELPQVDPVEAGLCNIEGAEDTEDTGGTQQPHESSVLQSRPQPYSPTSSIPTDPAEEAILATLPTGEGQRYYALFALARRLKSLPHLADADLADLKPLVRRWHQLALPVIGTKPFEESWLDFAEGWQRVRFPAGTGPLEALWLRATAEPLPAAALAYEQDGVRRLVAFCRQLQRRAGQAAFFLACRTAGALLGVEHTTAWRWLRLLEIDGVLRRISTGSKETHKANEYRYIGGLK